MWRTGYAASYEASPPTAAHGAGPKATPLFHEGKVFTVGISGIVAGFDARSGTLLWRTPAPSEPPYFSASSSLAGDAGIVIGHPGNYGPLTAFDSNTGAVKWTAGEGGLYASPIIAGIGGTRQAVSATQRNIVGVSLPEGKVLWQHPFVNNGAITPVLHKDTIIISGLDLGVAAIRPAKRDGKWIVDTVWETKSVSMYLSNPVVIDDALYGLSHRANGQVLRARCEYRSYAVARATSAGGQHRGGKSRRPSPPAERHCRVGRRQRQPLCIDTHQDVRGCR